MDQLLESTRSARRVPLYFARLCKYPRYPSYPRNTPSYPRNTNFDTIHRILSPLLAYVSRYFTRLCKYPRRLQSTSIFKSSTAKRCSTSTRIACRVPPVDTHVKYCLQRAALQVPHVPAAETVQNETSFCNVDVIHFSSIVLF